MLSYLGASPTNFSSPVQDEDGCTIKILVSTLLSFSASAVYQLISQLYVFVFLPSLLLLCCYHHQGYISNISRDWDLAHPVQADVCGG